MDCFGGFFVFCFYKRLLQNYKLNNKPVSGCEFYSFHNVTYSGFSIVCDTADIIVGLDVGADCQKEFC